MYLIRLGIFCAAVLAFGCGTDPDAVLDDADLALTIGGIGVGVAHLEVSVWHAGTPLVTRTPEVSAGGAVTLYLFDLPHEDLDLEVRSVSATGDVLQCVGVNAEPGESRQAMELDLTRLRGGCRDPNGPDGPDGPDEDDNHGGERPH